MVNVHLVLRKDGTTVQTLSIDGPAANVPCLLEKMATAIERALRQAPTD